MSDHYPSLMLLTGGHRSQWYKVEENKVELLAEFETEKITYSDNEGTAVKSSSGKGVRIGGTDNRSERRTEEEKSHLVETAKKTIDLWSKEKYEHFVVTLPDYLKNEFVDLLNNKLPEKSIHLVMGNFSHAGKAEVMELFKNSLKQIL